MSKMQSTIRKKGTIFHKLNFFYIFLIIILLFKVMYPDQNLEKEISNLTIDCTMDHCKWKGKLAGLSQHYKEKHPILSSPSKICDQCKMVLNYEDDLQEHKDKHCINGNKVYKKRASNHEDENKVLKKLKNNLETEQNHQDIVQIAVSAERFSKLEEMATTCKEMLSTTIKNLEDECAKLKVQLENSGKENTELLRKNADLEGLLKNRERKIKDQEGFIDSIIRIPDSSLLQITID